MLKSFKICILLKHTTHASLFNQIEPIISSVGLTQTLLDFREENLVQIQLLLNLTIDMSLSTLKVSLGPRNF